MSALSALRLVFLLAVLIASTAVAVAQSGRRGTPKSPVPSAPSAPTPPEVQPQPKTSSRLQLLVAIDNPSGFDRVSYRSVDIALDACVRRLAESNHVKPTPALQPITRAEALKAAKAETVRYVVWLQVGNERADYGADVSTQSAQLYVTYIIYEPGTGKVKGSGRAQYSAGRVGNVGVNVPGMGDALSSDYAIKESARLAADKILDAFQIKIGGWPR